MARVDVIVVSYNNRSTLRACVSALADLDDVRVIVADNASTDSSLEAVADLDVDVLQLHENRGFAFGCNRGAAVGSAPFLLFLNPDASIDSNALGSLLKRIQNTNSIGTVAPLITEENGDVQFSQRRFPRVLSTFARSLCLHRVSHRQWTDEVVRDPAAYKSFGTPEWVSGACMLVRRSAFDEVGGFDEGFFMYCEDTDLCYRLRQAGYTVAFEPAAVAVHRGGVSAPRASLLPTLAASRVRYAHKHYGSLRAAVERVGLLVEAVTRLVAAPRDSVRTGHLRSVRVLLASSRRP